MFATFLDPAVKHFTQQTLPKVNSKYFFMNILCIEPFYPQKKSTTERCFSLAQLRTIAILTTKTSL
jgi:hypothetical protein